MAIGRPITLTANVASKTISITATAGQTLFQPSGGYRINQLAVYRNGTRLVDGQDFTARDGASVTLLSGATVGDILEFQIFDSFNVANAIDTNSSTQTIDGALIVSGGITGATIGIQSGGTAIGTGKTLNFVGSGNTVVDRGNGSIDISISGSGGGGGGLGTAVDADATGAASRIFTTTRNDIISAGTSVTVDGSGGGGGMAFTKLNSIAVGTGATFHIGSGTTLLMDILNIF